MPDENSHTSDHLFSLQSSPSPSPSNDASNSQARRLQRRNCRFKESSLPRRSITPLSMRTLTDPDLSSTPQSPLPLQSSPHNASQPVVEHAVLQEISNSSLKRRRKKAGTSVDPQKITEMSWVDNENVAEGSFGRGAELHIPTVSRRSTSLGQTPNSSVKSKGARRAVSKESPTYVEHLESQLAALHIQVQALTSPSTARTQSAKLRSLNAETTLLRNELADWEAKFNDRLREQIQEHEAVVAGLRSQLRSMETEAESKSQRLSELELQSDLRAKSLDAVEATNQSLERRLEFMSELLATSPKKLDLHPEDSNILHRRSSRPLSLDPSFMSSNTASSPLRLSHRSSYHEASPLSPTLLARSRKADESDYDSAESTPSRPASRNQFPSPERRAEKGVRRMRRFYTGSCGPRSLILPATAHAGSYPASASVRDVSRSGHEAPDDFGRGDNCMSTEDAAQTTPTLRSGSHRRSSSMSIGSHREMPVRTPGLSPVLRNPFNFTVKPDQSSASGTTSPDPLKSVVVSTHSPDPTHGTTLFEELSRLKREESTTPVPASRPHSSQDLEPLPASLTLNPDLDSTTQNKDPRGPQSLSPTPNPKSAPSPIATSTSTSAPRTVPTILSRLTAAFQTTTHRARLLVLTVYSRTLLSRPALTFRWWLLGILLGPAVRANLFLCLPSRSHSHSHGHGQSLSSSYSEHNSLAHSNSSSYHNHKHNQNHNNPPPHRIKPPDLDLNHGLNPNPNRNPSPATTWIPLRRTTFHRLNAHARGLACTPYPCIDTSTDPGSPPLRMRMWPQEPHKQREQSQSRPRAPAPPPPRRTRTGLAAWLKLSVTLLLAVGIALREGPEALFVARGRGQGREQECGSEDECVDGCCCAGAAGPVREEREEEEEGGGEDGDGDARESEVGPQGEVQALGMRGVVVGVGDDVRPRGMCFGAGAGAGAGGPARRCNDDDEDEEDGGVGEARAGQVEGMEWGG